MTANGTALAIFIASYALFVLAPRYRSAVATAGAFLMVGLGPLTWRTALLESVQWNVIFLFFGTLILAELFMISRMPAVLAERLVRRMRTARGAMLVICALASALSAAVENVAVVLLVAPVALQLAERLNISPVRLLICIAICTNLQGTATLIGDPPSMILAGHLKMNFNDFFVYQGKPGIFFAVQCGALASLATIAWLLRQHREPTEPPEQESVRTWVPTGLLALLVVGLSLGSAVDRDFRWFAGTWAMLLATAGLVWYRFGPHWTSIRRMVRTLDWDTTFFLIGVFILVGGVSESGWLEQLARVFSERIGQHVLGAYVLIVMGAVLVSALVDNVPFLLAMIPVVQRVSESLQAPLPLLMYGLLIGACLGGNITPVGASANVVAVGLLKKNGHLVGFPTFMGVGIPFTLAAVTAASAFVWWIWAPR